MALTKGSGGTALTTQDVIDTQSGQLLTFASLAALQAALPAGSTPAGTVMMVGNRRAKCDGIQWRMESYPTHGLRTILLGHSFIDDEAISGTDVIDGYSAKGTVSWAQRILGQPLQVIKEIGFGGYRLLDVLALWPQLGEPLAPDLVIFSCGHNDLKGLYPANNAAAQALYPQQPADAQQTQLPYLITRTRAWLQSLPPQTKVVFLAESPPGQDPSGSALTVASNLAVRFHQWNRALWAFEREFNNVAFVPADRATIDPASVVSRNYVGRLYDQTHPGIVGGWMRGKLLAEALRRLIPGQSDPLPFSASNTHSATAITTSAAPSSDGTTLTIPLANGSTIYNIQVGDVVQLQPVGTTASDKALAGRYTILTSTTTQVTTACSVVATASAPMKVANSRQLFINPLFLTTTGGNAGGFSNSGTITGSLPLGVDVSNLPANWTLTFSTEQHLLDDARDGLAALTLGSAAVGTGVSATSADAMFDRSDVGKLLIAGAGVATITDVADRRTATVSITTAFAGTAIASMGWRVGSRGYGNVMRIDLSTGASGAAGVVNINLVCSAKAASPGTYDVFRKAHFGTRYQMGLEYEQARVVGGYNGLEALLYWRPADVATETAGTAVSARDLYRNLTQMPNSTLHPFPSDDMRLVLLTPEVTPTDPSSGNFLELMQGRLSMYASGANASAIIRIARFGLWAVDDGVQSGRISVY